MMAYLTTDRLKVFSDVRLLLYVFDLSNDKNLEEQVDVFRKVLTMLEQNSPAASVFVLLHKTDRLK